MSFLIFVKRQQAIIARKNDLNFRLTQLNQKLMDLQKYAAAIADGSVSLNDLMDAPASQFNRMSIFMMTGHQVGVAGAQETMNMMQASGTLNQVMSQFQGQNATQMQSQYQQMMYCNFYKQAKEKFSEQETKLLKVQDQKIESEKTNIENQLKMLQAEEEQISKGVDEGAKNSAPKYVA